MTTEQPKTRNESDVVLQFIVMLCLSVLFVPLGLLNLPPFIFLVLSMVGGVVGIIFARRRYSSWSHVLQPTKANQHPYRYTGINFLLLLAFILVMNHLAEPLKSIFVSVVLGPLNGYFLGYSLWPIALYLRRDKSVNG